MTQKLSKFLSFILFSTIFSLHSCQVEDLAGSKSSNNSKHVVVLRKNFEDLKKDSKLIESLSMFTNLGTSSFQKEYYDPDNDFYIDLDDVMFTLDENDNPTYTFYIRRELESFNGLENLVLKYNKTGEFDAILVQYNDVIMNLNSDDPDKIKQSIDQNVNFVYLGRKTLSDLESKFLEIEQQCFEPGYVYLGSHACTSGAHIFEQGAECDYWGSAGMATSGGYVFTLVPVSCLHLPGGSPSNSEGGFSTGPHQIGGANVPNKTPCEQLKRLTSKPIANTTPPKTVLSNLNDLTSQMSSNPRERMYILTPTSATEDQFVENYVEGPLDGGDVNLNLSNLYVSVLMHCHYKTSLLSIFSLSDIQEIYQLQSDSFLLNEGQTFTSMLVTVHETKYAIRFAPPRPNLQPYNQNYFIGWEFDNIKKAKEDSYYKKVNEANTPAQNELGFLHFIKAQNLGIEIYKADENFSQWSKLSIDATGKLKSTPCP